MQTQPTHEQATLGINLYLDLLKHTLVNWHYGHQVTSELPPISLKRKLTRKFLEHYGFKAVEPAPIPRDQMTDGVGTYSNGSYTLVGLKRLDNVEHCVRSVLEDDVPGDLLEAGVWQGGTCIFMKGVLNAFDVKDRKVWVADSFKGLPKPDAERYPEDVVENLHLVDQLSIPQEQVRENFERFGLLDPQVEFLEGYFKDTLHLAPIDSLAVLRLDGDMYESTMDTLNALYPKLSKGGYLIVDDFARENCAKAVHDYRRAHNIEEAIVEVDWTGAFWRKAN